MSDITPDISDYYGDTVSVLELPLQNYGQRFAFWGQIVTVECYHDNSKVRDMLNQNGKGKVLVVDGHGSCQRALIGDQMALKAMENDWEGIVIFGAVRDVVTLSQMDIGIQALGTCPVRSEKLDAGIVNQKLAMNGQTVFPGDYLYADWNGMLISKTELDLSVL
ncbi:putative 4-hydroxy-4-methyl-2-oxoglutarate aldolase [Vibrio zhugei]|uniref:4-hydroxy-4-methyl-2-oxoglutarate aldolase n=1 Tax=Vibrio zhugei TaxID=2479546 RepID=A0ABV7C8H9_9VIBR|nr:putative 4-hydroxy-4-methyl-2-oxoglutarate aldolase [Vibrio zhugei]